MNKAIANFVNRKVQIMSSIHKRSDGKFIVHIADLDSDSRIPLSRIFKNIENAIQYAEHIVGKGGVKC